MSLFGFGKSLITAVVATPVRLVQSVKHSVIDDEDPEESVDRVLDGINKDYNRVIDEILE